MKKRNLNWMLALLAALALVFAGACSDGSDDDGDATNTEQGTDTGGSDGTGTDGTDGNSTPGSDETEITSPTDYAASYYNTEWNRASIARDTTTTSAVTLTEAAIKLGSSTSEGGTLELTITVNGSDTASTKYTTYTNSVSITAWSVSNEGSTVTLTLESGTGDSNLTTLTLAKQADESLMLTATNASGTTASYVVSLSGGTAASDGNGGDDSVTTADIFASTLASSSALVAGESGTSFTQKAQE